MRRTYQKRKTEGGESNADKGEDISIFGHGDDVRFKQQQAQVKYSPQTCFQINFQWILMRLARLTSAVVANGKLKIDKFYPDHVEALMVTYLLTLRDFLMLEELWDKDME
eukprot:4167921-Ditylum_brightwellii.AAC.1